MTLYVADDRIGHCFLIRNDSITQSAYRAYKTTYFSNLQKPFLCRLAKPRSASLFLARNKIYRFALVWFQGCWILDVKVQKYQENPFS